MKHYSLSDVVTAEQFGRVREIVAQETAAQRTPHRAIVRYIQGQPDIARKCADVGLLTDFFAYQLEAIAQKNPLPARRLTNDE